MSVFQSLQTVTVELNISIKVHVVESLHWNLVSTPVLEFVGLLLESKVMFDWASSISGFFIFARTEHRVQGPKSHEDGNGCEEAKED